MKNQSGRKLEEKMSKINLITAPDKLFNDNLSFLLVYPSEYIKEQFQNLIANWDFSINVYVYDHNIEQQEHDYDWLLSVLHICNYTILDVDNFDRDTRLLTSYLISKPKVYWLTKQETPVYNKLSFNRIYNLDWLEQDITNGGYFGEK